MSNKKILIIGSEGCIGRHLVKYYLDLNLTQKYDSIIVTGIDLKPGIYTNKVIDINKDSNSLQNYLLDNRPDCIINVSGSFGPDHDSNFNNYIATKNLLEAVNNLSSKKYDPNIILTGSSAEYGDVWEATESTECNPVSFYGLYKLQQTLLAQYFVRRFGMNIIIARVSNVFAFDLSPQLLLGKIIRANEPTKLGNLTADRDYIHIDDVIRAYDKLLPLCRCQRGEIFNISEYKSVNIKMLVDYITELRKLPPNFFTGDNNSSRGVCLARLNNQKLKSTGWINTYSISDTVSFKRISL